MYNRAYTSDRISELKENEIFVFGSNLAGAHGGGAARFAYERFGAYNIMEPVGEVFTDYAQIDLAVIPGVAFDRQLNRMGRGKGFYDRLLPQLGDAYKIGICFDFQLVESIECEEHDIRMDEVISGK